MGPLRCDVHADESRSDEEISCHQLHLSRPAGRRRRARSFGFRSDHQALAELGFVVVIIDGTCNPDRSKSFHDACYGNMADNTLEDQIAGIKQLAAKNPYHGLDACRSLGTFGRRICDGGGDVPLS